MFQDQSENPVEDSQGFGPFCNYSKSSAPHNLMGFYVDEAAAWPYLVWCGPPQSSKVLIGHLNPEANSERFYRRTGWFFSISEVANIDKTPDLHFGFVRYDSFPYGV